jgi:hypothetical protein
LLTVHIPSGAVHIPSALGHIPFAAVHIPSGARHIPFAAVHIPSVPDHIPFAVGHIRSKAIHIPFVIIHIPFAANHIPFGPERRLLVRYGRSPVRPGLAIDQELQRPIHERLAPYRMRSARNGERLRLLRTESPAR